MFKHLLVPLDGSKLAEAALPPAAYLAQTLGATVTLLHVIEHNAPQTVHSERHLTSSDEACAYLGEVMERAFPSTVEVDTHVHTEEVTHVARSIVAHSQEFKPDLIVMCTHGRGGLHDWLYGSIAQRVIGMGTTATLMVRPRPGGGAPFNCRLMLVPLDGTAEHEQGLPAAADMAKACNAALHLAVVVPTRADLTGGEAATAAMLPAATTAMLELAQASALDYLRGQMSRLQALGLTVTTQVSRGDPAATIVETARHVGSDLIVLGTHGKTGMGAFWAGSVAPKVSSQSDVPLLLVPLTPAA